MICYKCGKLQPENVNYCSFCGSSLKSDNLSQNINDVTHNVEISNSLKTNNDVLIRQATDSNSIIGIFSFVLGIINLAFVIIYCFFDSFLLYGNINLNLNFIVPAFSVINVALSIVSIYSDKNYERFVFSFYMNFAIFVLVMVNLFYMFFI